MQFSVTFKTTSNGNVDNPQPLIEKLGDAGIDILDDLRQSDPDIASLACKDIKAHVNCPINGASQNFSLSEYTARRSNLFGGKTQVDVEVPPFSFGRFLKLKVKKYYTSVQVAPPLKILFMEFGSGKHERRVESVESSYELDSDEVIKQWEAAGFPLKWDLSAPVGPTEIVVNDDKR